MQSVRRRRVCAAPISGAVWLVGALLCTGALGLASAARGQSTLSSAFAADSLRAIVGYLADDRLQGRGAGSAGLDAAAEYIAVRFKAAGLEPAGDADTYFQGFDVTIGVRPEGRNTLRLAGHDLQLDHDWVAYGFAESGAVQAPMVFAGYGIRAPQAHYDDYAGLDVKGKIVLVLRFEPGHADSANALQAQLVPAADLRRKAIEAREAGAVGMLVVTGPASGEPDRLGRLRADTGYYSTGIPCGQISREALAKAVPGLDVAALQKRIDAGGKPLGAAIAVGDAEWSIGLTKQRTRLRNVLALLPGRDPHHVLVIGAHYDHLGMGGESSLAPDAHEVHNGADDNASGTAALVAIARAFAAGPKPAQSVLFAAFSGEELGLVGSGHYVKQPSVPLEFTTAMLNMDMVGRLRDRKLMVYGTDTAKEFHALVDSLNRTGPKFQLTMKGDGYGPSDHMSFFEKNVPVLHFFTGAHADYHKPTDDAALVNYDGLSEVAAFVADVARAVQDEPLTFAAATGPAPSAGDGGGSSFGSYLGTIPDYSQDESLKGVLLSGVRAGGPAEKAGLQSGDLIVKIDAMTIGNIYDYTHVLKTRQPGETLKITVLRAGATVDLQATLGVRPGK